MWALIYRFVRFYQAAFFQDINDDSTATNNLDPEEEDNWERIQAELETVKTEIEQIDNKIKHLDRKSKMRKELRDKKKPLMSRKNGLEKE